MGVKLDRDDSAKKKAGEPLHDSNERLVTEAIYTGGVLKPVEAIQLCEKERVRVIVERIEPTERPDRDALVARLREGIDSMDFRSRGPYPLREELHDRG